MIAWVSRFFRHCFIPHEGNNQRGRVLHQDVLSFVVVLLLLLNFGFKHTIQLKNTTILGVSMHLSVQDLLTQTNTEREKYGLPPLSYNETLSQAAADKAIDMFAENYWAHYSPEGTSPWYFFEKNNYHYLYAGENLAKDFTDSGGVVRAWMQSEKHRENILQSDYTDIGFAVKEGVLQGKPTVLVVQLFGTPDPSYHAAEPPTEVKLPQVQGAITKNPVVDRHSVSKQVSIAILALLASALAADLYVRRRRGQAFSSANYAHLVLLAVIIAGILIINPGSIL